MPTPARRAVCEGRQGISGHSIEHASLFARGGWTCSGWHIDSNMGGSVVSQLDSGRIVVLHHSYLRWQDPLLKRPPASIERLRSLPSKHRVGLLQFREHIMYYIQETAMWSFPHSNVQCLSR